MRLWICKSQFRTKIAGVFDQRIQERMLHKIALTFNIFFNQVKIVQNIIR